MRLTAEMQGALRRTQIMNYTLKSGGLVSNALGTIAVSYSLLHCLLANGKIRNFLRGFMNYKEENIKVFISSSRDRG